MNPVQDFGPYELLRKLTETPGVSGREERIRELILAETEGLWDETRVDNLGNLICLKRATPPAGKRTKTPQQRPQRVMLACHMDEIGFYVRYIDENGYLRVHNAGGFDTRNLFSRRVMVHGKQDLIGVMNPGTKPIHVASEEEKKKIPEIREFAIDLFRTKAQVEKLVEVGDPITMLQTTEMMGDAICGKAMDNRVALWVAINAIRKAYGVGQPGEKPSKKTPKATGSPYDIYFVACAQEEVGLRGATTAAFGIDPDIGIAIDVTLACDTPGVSKDDAITEFGKGVAIKWMDSSSISHRGLFDEFVALAKKHKIPFQREILARGGTDAGAVQRTRAGTKAITLSVPTRYVHTIVEAIHKKDALGAVDLLAAWLAG